MLTRPDSTERNGRLEKTDWVCLGLDLVPSTQTKRCLLDYKQLERRSDQRHEQNQHECRALTTPADDLTPAGKEQVLMHERHVEKRFNRLYWNTWTTKRVLQLMLEFQNKTRT